MPLFHTTLVFLSEYQVLARRCQELGPCVGLTGEGTEDSEAVAVGTADRLIMGLGSY